MAQNDMLKAQFALMAALDPEKFIDMAVQQGFKPEDLAKSTGLPPPKGPANYTDGLAKQIDKNMQPIAQMGAPPTGQLPPPQVPTAPVPTGPSPALMQMMGISPQGQPPGVGFNTVPPAAPTPPGAMGPQLPLPTGPTPSLQMMMGMGQQMGAPPPPVPMAPPVNIPAQGAPPEINPQLAAMVAGRPASTQPLAPPADNGMFVDPSVAAMTPDPSTLAGTIPAPPADVAKGAWNIASTLLPLQQSPTPPAPGPNISQSDLFNGMRPPVTPATVGGMPQQPAGMVVGAPEMLPPEPTTPATSPNVSQFDLMTGAGAGKVPVSKAGVQTADSKVKIDAAKAKADAKSTYDALASVGGSMARGGSGRGAPGSAGVHGGQIQPGEITDLLMKLLQPAQYNPGFIPYGKLF